MTHSDFSTLNHETRHGYRLLILEDSDDLAEILRVIGQSAGYQVRRVADRGSVGQVCSDFQPSVLLINLGCGIPPVSVPIQDAGIQDEGVDLLRHLADQQSAAQIVILSGNPPATREAVLEQGLSLGLNMVGHIGKPFDIDVLEQRLIALRGQ